MISVDAVSDGRHAASTHGQEEPLLPNDGNRRAVWNKKYVQDLKSGAGEERVPSAPPLGRALEFPVTENQSIDPSIHQSINK